MAGSACAGTTLPGRTDPMRIAPCSARGCRAVTCGGGGTVPWRVQVAAPRRRRLGRARGGAYVRARMGRGPVSTSAGCPTQRCPDAVVRRLVGKHAGDGLVPREELRERYGQTVGDAGDPDGGLSFPSDDAFRALFPCLDGVHGASQGRRAAVSLIISVR